MTTASDPHRTLQTRESRKPRGIVLTTALFLVAMGTTLQTTSLLRSMSELQVAQHSLRQTQAFYYAEAGLDYASQLILADLRDNGNWDQQNPNGPTVLGPYQFAGGSYQVTVTDLGAQGLTDRVFRLDAEGWPDVNQAGNKVVLTEHLWMTNHWLYGFLGSGIGGAPQNRIEHKSQITAYNSQPPYGFNPTALIGDASTTPPDPTRPIFLIQGLPGGGGGPSGGGSGGLNGPVVDGDIVVAAPGNPSDYVVTENGGQVTGTIGTLANPPQLNPVAPPATCNVGDLKTDFPMDKPYSGPGVRTLCAKKFIIESDVTVQFTTPIIVYVSEGVELRSGASIAANASQSKSSPDPTNKAIHLQIYFVDPPPDATTSQTFVVETRASLMAGVYAPYADAAIGTQGTGVEPAIFQGALLTHSLQLGSNANRTDGYLQQDLNIYGYDLVKGFWEQQ